MMQKMLLNKKMEEKEITIGIISDSHDNMNAIKKAVEFFNENDVELVIHAGDIVSPFTADVFKNLKCDMILIYGNNDGDKLYLKQRFKNIGDFYGDPCIMELYGKKFAITHHPEIVDVLSMKYDIVIYGHTHEKDFREENKLKLIINPGECCGYLSGIESVALLNPEKMTARIIEL